MGEEFEHAKSYLQVADEKGVTLYDHVVWNGIQFPGHWSWIYVARNHPSNNGTHIWQWMAQQQR